MRLALALCFGLAACASDPAPTDASSPLDAGGSLDAATDTGPADLGSLDTGATLDALDVPPEAAVMDAGPVDTGADAASLDAGDSGADAGVCPNGRTAVCDGRMVSLVNGERDDAGIRHHCGMCGNTCAPGEGCVSCRCEL